MKLIHIETKYVGDIKLPRYLINTLPKYVFLSTTVQFRNHIQSFKKQLESANIKVELFYSSHGKNSGQILGCDIFKIEKQINGFVYIGDGLFHPTALLYNNVKQVFYYNPFTKKLTILTEKDLEKINNKRKANMSQFLLSTKIGILVTVKPGQKNFKQAMTLKKKLEKEDKQAYIFISETFDMNELENFPFIECWVNTACPRIIQDTSYPIINLFDLRETIMKGENVMVV